MQIDPNLPPSFQPPSPPFHPTRRRSLSNSDAPHYLSPLHRHEGEREKARERRDEKRRERKADEGDRRKERRREEEVKNGLERARSFGFSPPKSRAPRRLQKIQSAPSTAKHYGIEKAKGWITAPPPPNNEERLRKLQSYNILDTPPEVAFDDITKIVACMCGVPMATLSFVDDSRQFFKSRLGVDVTGTPIDQALCAHTIIDVDGFMEVKDTKKDERFYGNPQVTSPDVALRFYAGAALITPDNHALGALCALDKKPRELTEQQKEAMKGLARLVVDQLESRAKNVQLIDMSNQLKESERKLQKLNEDLVIQNSVLKKQITELHGNNSGITMNTPASKVVELLSTIQGFLKDKEQKVLLQEAIKIIASHKLYEVDVEEAIAAGENVDDVTKGFLLTQLDSPTMMKENIWETALVNDAPTEIVAEALENGSSPNGQENAQKGALVKSASEDMTVRLSRGLTRKFSIVAIPKLSFDGNDEMAKVSAVLGSVSSLVSDINEWDFDVFKFTEASKQPLFYTTLTVLHDNEFFRKMPIPAAKLISFLSEIESGYVATNPYHNNIHASDVMLGSNFMATASGVLKYTTPAEHLALLIAAAVHDLGHLGVNNSFLISTLHELAIAHNDKSVLENYHCVQAFKLLYNPTHDFLVNLSMAERQEIRKLIIELVLATDMSQHVEIFNTFQSKRGTREGLDIANNKQDRLLVLKMIIKCADISNSAKKSSLYLNWANRIMEEFWCQGDQERKLGIPISAFMDRTQPDVPKCQSGFIQFIALPFYTAMVEQFPKMAICVENMKANLDHWKN